MTDMGNCIDLHLNAIFVMQFCSADQNISTLASKKIIIMTAVNKAQVRRLVRKGYKGTGARRVRLIILRLHFSASLQATPYWV